MSVIGVVCWGALVSWGFPVQRCRLWVEDEEAVTSQAAWKEHHTLMGDRERGISKAMSTAAVSFLHFIHRDRVCERNELKVQVRITM